MDEQLWRIDQPGLTIHIRPPTPILVLRLRNPDPALIERIGDIVGQALPVDPNVATGDAIRINWLSPWEWMVAGSPNLLEPLSAAIQGHTGHVADLGDGRVRFAVAGTDARHLLAKGTSLDLHPRAFPAGRCAQTQFAQTLALIDRSSAQADEFVVTADISFSDHLQRWFADASIEFRKGAA